VSQLRVRRVRLCANSYWYVVSFGRACGSRLAYVSIRSYLR
jgi:hypothetical protein